MNTQKLAELDVKYGSVLDLALNASKTYSALTAAKKENKPLDGLAEAAADVAEKLRQAVTGWDGKQAADVASYIQYVGLALDAMTFEGEKQAWDPKKSKSYAMALVALKNAFVIKTEEESGNDERVKAVNSRIRSMLPFIELAEAVHYKPVFGLNDRAVREVLERAKKEIASVSSSDSRMVRANAPRLQEKLLKLKSSVPADWLKEKQSGSRIENVALNLGETMKPVRFEAGRKGKK